MENRQLKSLLPLLILRYKITIILSRDDLAERKSQYRGAELQHPATENEIKDALERARINKDNQHYTMKECRLYGFDIAVDLKAETIPPINYEKILKKRKKGENESLRNTYKHKKRAVRN